MKNLLKTICFIFAIALVSNLFTSCKKDDLTTDDTTTTTTQNNTTGSETPSNNNEITNQEINQLISLGGGDEMDMDSMEFCDCFEAFNNVDWEATDAEVIAQLEIVFQGMTEVEIEALLTPVCTDDEIYINACVAECNGAFDYVECDFDDYEDDWTACFDFVYPITVIFPDNSSQTINTDDELIDAVDAWYNANPNSDDDPTLAYPVHVTFTDSGVTVPVANDEELENLFEVCEEYEFDDCFEFIFPMEIQFPDASVIAINSLYEGENAVDAWYDANPNSDEDPTIVYPIQVKLEDGTIKTINSEEDLDDLFDDCYGGMGGCLVMKPSEKALTKNIAKMKKKK
ncbi:MAG: hypothetical protein AAF573_22835 [Bacteroidota bacterium]